MRQICFKEFWSTKTSKIEIYVGWWTLRTLSIQLLRYTGRHIYTTCYQGENIIKTSTHTVKTREIQYRFHQRNTVQISTERYSTDFTREIQYRFQQRDTVQISQERYSTDFTREIQYRFHQRNTVQISPEKYSTDFTREIQYRFHTRNTLQISPEKYSTDFTREIQYRFHTRNTVQISHEKYSTAFQMPNHLLPKPPTSVKGRVEFVHALFYVHV